MDDDGRTGANNVGSGGGSTAAAAAAAAATESGPATTTTTPSGFPHVAEDDALLFAIASGAGSGGSVFSATLAAQIPLLSALAPSQGMEACVAAAAELRSLFPQFAPLADVSELQVGW